jgi:2-hydroxy-3-keto-5-methylthiopentenyl-1-phosphate phosphatase
MQQPFIEKIVSFGKYIGKPYEEIKSSDVSYCNWVLKQANTRGPMKDFQEWLKLHAKRITCEKCNGSGLGHMM